MKLWQHTAQPLPVTLRPLRTETLFSYACRLSTANELRNPTTLIRALGHPHGNLTQTALHHYDITLNAPALDRLETFTGIPAQRLRKALPTLNRHADLPSDIPRTKLFGCRNLRRPCDGCAGQAPGRPTIITYPPGFPPICLRHQRWLSGDESRPQLNLATTPEMMTAHRRYRRLRARIAIDTDSQDWLRHQLFTACSIVQDWVAPSHQDNPRLHRIWAARTATLQPGTTTVTPSDLLVFPEAVALAEILTDLRWRRHVAMAQHSVDLKPFYHRVAARLGQPPIFAAIARCGGGWDPLRHWVETFRHQHKPTRTKYWQRQRNGLPDQSFPEIRHFK
jgi:hypothetical protein